MRERIEPLTKGSEEMREMTDCEIAVKETEKRVCAQLLSELLIYMRDVSDKPETVLNAFIGALQERSK